MGVGRGEGKERGKELGRGRDGGEAKAGTIKQPREGAQEVPPELERGMEIWQAPSSSRGKALWRGLPTACLGM